MNNLRYLILIIFLFSSGFIQAKKVEIFSPDKQLQVSVNIEKEITYTVKFKNNEIMVNCPASMTLSNIGVLGKDAILLKTKEAIIEQIVTSAVPYKNSRIPDHCTETTLLFKGNFSMVFRVYDTGFAYRFITKLKDQVDVVSENVGINFSGDVFTWFPEEKSFMSHYESLYPKLKLSEISDQRMCCLPVLFKTQSGVDILLSETDLVDYPCLFLKGTGKNSMTGIQPKVPAKIKDLISRSDRTEVIEAEENYIAKTTGTRSFPWRTFIVTDNDAEIVASEINFILAGQQLLENTSWIKPGKVAWDWWNANNIYHVDFKSGINNNTYKYFIDFASAYGLEYIILDEGWSKTTTNLLECAKDIDVVELVNYGKEKNVGVILWLLWKPLDKDLDNILDLYKKWGVKGIKVDFMQRADQYMVNYYERVAKATAQHEMLVDFHGAFKPSGLQRRYPNVINFEGVRGNENNKWSAEITPLHNVTLPFTRMVAGPMDFTPGAMNNASAKDFAISFNRPMSMGTRAHQVAMYVVYESPLQMLCESPTEYYREKECTEFISKIPTVWEETKVLDASIAEYIIVARRNGNKWYLGGMTNETARNIEIDLSFLPEGTFKMNSLVDGINTNMNARDYKLTEINISNKTKLKVEMAAGGGFTAIITL